MLRTKRKLEEIVVAADGETFAVTLWMSVAEESNSDVEISSAVSVRKLAGNIALEAKGAVISALGQAKAERRKRRKA